MVSVLRFDNSLFKRKRKLNKFLMMNNDYNLVVSSFYLKNKEYITSRSIKQTINLLNKGKKVIFVYNSFFSYLELIKRITINELRIIKKLSKKRKMIDFLSFNQMEVLQLYFDCVNNRELQIAKAQKISLCFDYNYGKISYCVTSFDKTNFINTLERKRNYLIIKGNIDKSKIIEILMNNDIGFKKLKREKNGLKIKSKNIYKMIDVFYKRMVR